MIYPLGYVITISIRNAFRSVSTVSKWRTSLRPQYAITFGPRDHFSLWGFNFALPRNTDGWYLLEYSKSPRERLFTSVWETGFCRIRATIRLYQKPHVLVQGTRLEGEDLLYQLSRPRCFIYAGAGVVNPLNKKTTSAGSRTPAINWHTMPVYLEGPDEQSSIDN